MIDLEIFRPGVKSDNYAPTISKCDEENESNVEESGEKRETKEREETKDQKRERAKRQIGWGSKCKGRADGLIERVKRIPANSWLTPAAFQPLLGLSAARSFRETSAAVPVHSKRETKGKRNKKRNVIKEIAVLSRRDNRQFLN